ncbi:MAG: SAM-dependent methyltransferase, partial [Dehalococcoidia bacterium]|nr:SAM-dependent methyltransferase [Dehalococcoidia bacterium]
MQITVVGLGPGNPDLLTRAAIAALQSARLIALRTVHHPVVAALPSTAPVLSFDADYDTAETFDQLYDTIVRKLLALAEDGPFVYATPGHPLVGEETVRRLRQRAPERGVSVTIVAGVSFIDAAVAAIGVDPVSDGLQVVDAHAPTLDPFRPALIAQVYNQRLASLTKLALLETYPPEHPVSIIQRAGEPTESVRVVPLFEVDRVADIDHLTTLYVPPIGVLDAVGAEPTFKHVVYRLRRECPWDREQTHQTLRKYLIEETFEAIDAIDDGDTTKLAEELGDVLLQVYLHAAIGEEQETFTLRDVLAHITTKL